MKENTIWLEVTSSEDLGFFQTQLEKIKNDLPEGKAEVVVQMKFSIKTVKAVITWVVAFLSFGKKYFFPNGKFRAPKLLELLRNFQIIKAVVQLKNTLIGILATEGGRLEVNDAKQLAEKYAK